VERASFLSSLLFVIIIPPFAFFVCVFFRYKTAATNGKPPGTPQTLPFLITENGNPFTSSLSMPWSYSFSSSSSTLEGMSVHGEGDMSLSELLHDTTRVEYYKEYLANVRLAVTEGQASSSLPSP